MWSFAWLYALIYQLFYLLGWATPPIYDAIIVGAGAGGCPLAQTLAEAGLNVLLLERGNGVLPPETANRRDTWDALRSECSETIRGADGVAMFTGNCIGGATSFNLGMYIEEQPKWIVDNFGAGFGTEDEVANAYEWVRERVAAPATERADSVTNAYIQSVINTFENPGMFNLGDVSSTGSPRIEERSIWRTYSTFDSLTGERRSADTMLNRQLENLVVRADTNVNNILFDGDFGVPFEKRGDVPRARCVRLEGTYSFVPEEILCVRHGGRIYLAAGAIYSPTLLLNSGIGPGKEIVDNPEVGENFSDKPLLPLAGNFQKEFNNLGEITFGHIAGSTEVTTSNATKTLLLEEFSYGVPGLLKLLGSWRNNIPVFARNFAAIDLVFVFTDFCQAEVESDEPASALCDGFVNQVKNGCDTTTGITVAVSNPSSKGRVTVDRKGRPKVDGGYLSTNEDLEALAMGARSAFQQLVARQDPVALQRPCDDSNNKTCVEQSCPDIFASLLKLSKDTLNFLNPETANAIPIAPASIISPNFFEQFIKSTDDNLLLGQSLSQWVTGGYHYCGTNGIGKVVDENLNVIGTRGLYVADASVIPQTPRVNSMATILMLGRRAGLKFIEERQRL